MDDRAKGHEEPMAAAFEVVAIDDRARVPVRYVKLAIVAAAMVVVALVGVNLLPADHDVLVGGPAVSASLSPSSSPVRSPSPSSAVARGLNPFPLGGEVVPGRYWVSWTRGDAASPMRIQLTMPAGWWSADAGRTISRHPLSDGGPSLTLSAHDVTRVATDLCPPEGSFVLVGPTVEDLTTVLSSQLGSRMSGPTEAMLGGYPARKIVLTLPADRPASCGGPEGRLIWEDDTKSSGFGLLEGGTATIYVVDVNGTRLVVTSHDRGSSAEDLAQLEGIIASIDIEPPGVGPIEPLSRGRHSLTVDGVPFSFSAPSRVPGGWDRFGGVSINKSIVGPQGAEAMIYWAGFTESAYADPCGDVLSLPVASSAADLASAVAAAPGTELVEGPLDVTVGGRPAKHVVVTVREDVGCDPGYFYAWRDVSLGPLWSATTAGDTIRVWIVDVDGTRLFIAGETHADLFRGQAMTEAEQTGLDREIRQIVDSIRFEPLRGPG